MQILKVRMFLTYKTSWLSIIYIICLNYNTSIISRQLIFDLVAFIFGDMSWFSRIIYAIVGLGGLYLISLFGRIRSIEES